MPAYFQGMLILLLAAAKNYSEKNQIEFVTY